jgi:hypothetical protein
MNRARCFAAELLLTMALAQGASNPTPVVVELFTSEGCSSCPPADLLLTRLQKTQPVAGVQVITLSEHVDYWNQLGWTDPFSSNALTLRQQHYARAIRNSDVYTPQMVIDGKAEFVGSDERKALQTIAEAARGPKTTIDLRCLSDPLAVQVRIEDGTGFDADVMLAVTENGLQSNVHSGENRGRLMAHSSVTRRLTSIGRVKKQQPFNVQSALAIEKGWKRENISAVVFLQDRSNLRIFGAAQIPLSGCRAD